MTPNYPHYAQTDRMQEMFDKEREEHPDLSDEEIWQIVEDHMREGSYDYQGERKLNQRFSIPFYTRFSASPIADGRDIQLIGTFLDYGETTNGWYIDPAEEENIVASAKRPIRPTMRLAHSKEPERIIGDYRDFVPAEDDGCMDADGKPLGRHIDFRAVVTPEDPQIRTNILKGYIGDISPGLDAQVFCDQCGEMWGLDQENKLVKSCEHQDAKGVLRNINVKEGSIVTEPAFEGRTRFRPTFAMFMNGLFSPEREPLATRVRPDKEGSRQAMTGGNKNKGSETHMVSKSKEDETDGEHRANATLNLEEELKKLGFQRITAAKAESDSESEGEGEGEGDDDDARIRATLKKMKALKKFEDDLGKMGYTRTPPQTAEGANGIQKAEGDGAQAPDHTEPDEDDMPGKQPAYPKAMKNMSKEDQEIVIKAHKLLARAEASKLLEDSKRVLAEQEEVENLVVLQNAKVILEKSGDKESVKVIDARLRAAAEANTAKRLEAQKQQSTSGAQVPSAEPKFTQTKTQPLNMQSQTPDPAALERFNNAVKTEFMPGLRASFRNVVFVKEQGAE